MPLRGREKTACSLCERDFTGKGYVLADGMICPACAQRGLFPVWKGYRTYAEASAREMAEAYRRNIRHKQLRDGMQLDKDMLALKIDSRAGKWYYDGTLLDGITGEAYGGLGFCGPQVFDFQAVLRCALISNDSPLLTVEREGVKRELWDTLFLSEPYADMVKTRKGHTALADARVAVEVEDTYAQVLCIDVMGPYDVLCAPYKQGIATAQAIVRLFAQMMGDPRMYGPLTQGAAADA